MIVELMTSDHRKCDDRFGEMELLASKNDFKSLNIIFEEWMSKIHKHFQIEEDSLFLALEQFIARPFPPVEMMKFEHAQVKMLMNQMQEAIGQKNKQSFLDVADTCMTMIQQHNMKEENMLYQMAETHLDHDTKQSVINYFDKVYG